MGESVSLTATQTSYYSLTDEEKLQIAESAAEKLAALLGFNEDTPRALLATAKRLCYLADAIERRACLVAEALVEIECESSSGEANE